MSRNLPFEVVGRADAELPLVMTCEHAASDLPEWSAQDEDRPFLDDHWGWDPGAAELTRALCEEIGGVAILSRFSRLVCDPNRDPSDPTFVVEKIAKNVNNIDSIFSCEATNKDPAREVLIKSLFE